MRAILIDDEEDGRVNLEMILKKYSKDIEIVGTADSMNAGYAVINKLKPDLIFLDIELHDGSGFDLLSKFPTIDFDVVFTTAYENYAIKAIKFSAIDYLLKPLDIDELLEAIQKVKLKQTNKTANLGIQNLLANIKSGTPQKIGIANMDGISYVNVDDIIRCEADVNYTHIFLKNNQRLTTAKTLKEYEMLLAEHSFVRTHQSHLVNPIHVKKYLKMENKLLLSDGSHVDVSFRKNKEVMQQLSKFLL